MTRRFVRCATFLPVLGAALLHAPGVDVTGVTATPPLASPVVHEVHREPAEPHVAIPPGVEAFVAGDMVVHWIDEGTEGAAALRPAPDVAVELTIGSDEAAHDAGDHGVHEAAHLEGPDDQHLGEAASGGYALFSSTARWIPGGYTIRLTGADARVEEYRDELTAAARAASATAGVPIRVAPGRGGPADPARGEIAVVIGSGPCGAGSVGCGGPSLDAREIVAGRVWLHPSSLGIPTGQRSNLAAHELGHALGLQHFDGSWSDGRQVMYPVITGVTSYRAGDSAGLRHVAGTADRPAGAVTARTYAAGRAHVTGTVASGTRVRISSGSTVAEVPAVAGRFAGALPLPAGSHVVCAAVVDPAPGFRPALGCGPLDAPGAPSGRLDPLHVAGGAVRVTGWAVDPQTADAVQVQVTRNGAVVSTVRADRLRADLGGLAVHYGTAHGFDAGVSPVPGRNRICVQILGVGSGGDASAGCAEVEHTSPPPSPAPTILVQPDTVPTPTIPSGPVTGTALAVVDDVLHGVVDVVAGPTGLVAGLGGLLGR